MVKNPYKVLEKIRKYEPRIDDLEEKNRILENLLQEERKKRIRSDDYTRKLERRILQLEKNHYSDYCSQLDPAQYPHELKAWYFQETGKELNLERPRTYNEKIQWFKIYGQTAEISHLVDKISVRDFVASKIGEKYLIPLLGTWDYPEDIDFASLPEKFVLKANHGSGYNCFVYDKSRLDMKDLMKKANHWLRQDFAFTYGFEMQYHYIKRRLLAEPYLENDRGDLYDYKFRCFNGKVEMVSYGMDRKGDSPMDFFDRDWNHLPIKYKHYPNSGKPIPRPDNLEEMIEKAEVLAAGFPQVRVDFYRTNDGKVYFGEMTFTSSSGVAQWDPPELDLQLGQLFSYPGMPE